MGYYYNSIGGSVYVVFGGPSSALSLFPSTTLNSTAWSNNVTVASAANLMVGQVINSANFAYDTTITAISGTTLTLSNRTGVTASGTPVNVIGYTVSPTLLNGTYGVEYDSPAASYNTGGTVVAGDVNGDGIADILIGAGAYNSPCYCSGAIYVVFGSKCGGPNSGYSACTTPITLNGTFLNGTTGAEFDGISNGRIPSGLAVADINGDGIGDILIGRLSNNDAGGTGVIYGRNGTIPSGAATWPTSGQPLTIGAASYINGTNGFYISGIPGSIATGDVNGDGYIDMVISTGGNYYVVFGKSSAWAYSTSVNTAWFNGVNGVKFTGPDPSYINGPVVIGDINGDGFKDIAMAAPYASPNSVTYAGSVYVYFGKKTGWLTSAYNLGGL